MFIYLAWAAVCLVLVSPRPSIGKPLLRTINQIARRQARGHCFSVDKAAVVGSAVPGKEIIQSIIV